MVEPRVELDTPRDLSLSKLERLITSSLIKSITSLELILMFPHLIWAPMFRPCHGCWMSTPNLMVTHQLLSLESPLFPVNQV
ncbi:hypothetical protein D8674_006436 [Pyrus ussuriensis x Pyrus communis]|uniref:Uncharacterized protein n=1 Tax=Pyrus ussuriensis x Pyrus communis TaxID=2448454 RepID=A0A5N5FUE5_9ROSA|nr:hypothetical protein D8674_006436 [Pyrus ussuriensis x Pyrus communis]